MVVSFFDLTKSQIFRIKLIGTRGCRGFNYSKLCSSSNNSFLNYPDTTIKRIGHPYPIIAFCKGCGTSCITIIHFPLLCGVDICYRRFGIGLTRNKGSCTHIVNINTFGISCCFAFCFFQSLSFPESSLCGRGEVFCGKCTRNCEGGDDRHMVAEQCAIRFLIVVGIKDEVFQLQLQRAALGGEVENLVYYLSRLISLAACLVRHHQCFTVIGRIRAVLELLYPRIFDVVGGRQRDDEVIHQLVAGVAAVGIAQNELRPAIAVALDSFGQLRELLVLHGYLVRVFSGVHVEHVHIHLHVVAQIYGIEAEALVDKRIGSVVEITQRLVPLGPALVSERHSLAIFVVLILEQEHQAIGIEMETAEDATGIDSSAPCAHLIVLPESNDQVSVIVEVLADTHHVDTLVDKILSDGLRTFAPVTSSTFAHLFPRGMQHNFPNDFPVGRSKYAIASLPRISPCGPRIGMPMAQKLKTNRSCANCNRLPLGNLRLQIRRMSATEAARFAVGTLPVNTSAKGRLPPPLA